MSVLQPTFGRPKFGRHARIIPTLLIDRDGRLVKSVRFGKRTYIGDPINAVKIFNTKRVDELVLLDIDASTDVREPNYSLIADIASEAFMPVAYGGGLDTMTRLERAIECGVEKVILSSALRNGTALIEQAAARWGSQSVVVCLPFRRSWLGKSKVSILQGKKDMSGTPAEIARQVAAAGAGEIIAYSIDRDGTWDGYDLDQLGQISKSADIPVVACGGAAGLDDFRKAISESGCSAAAAGSMFIYQAKGRGVLISYPSMTI
jgi:cyclase